MKIRHYLWKLKDIFIILFLIWFMSWLYNGSANRRYLQRVYVDIAEHYDVVAFGDSLIEGLGATQTQGFVAIVADRLGVDVLNMGIRRNKLPDMIDRVSDDVLRYTPKLVIMTGGSNDMVHGYTWDQISENLRTLFQLFADNNIHVLYLASTTGYFSDPYGDDSALLAAEFPNVTYVSNIQENIMRKPAKTFDLVHPNDVGHREIADRIEPIVRTLLDELEIPYDNKQITVDTAATQQQNTSETK